ncbi:MAG: ABC transporter permease [Candidatus Saccharimonadales bacterium]
MQQIIQRWRIKYRYSLILLKELVKTDFKLRYQGSFLGYIWSLLKPLFMFVILYLLFGVILNAGEGMPHYPVYLLLGLLLWNYFAEVTNTSVTAIVGKGDLLRKLNFPKYVIVLSGSFSALINLFINFIVLGIFILFLGVDLRWSALLIPLTLVELFVFAIGVSFLLSALYVRFRDISYIWEILMQAAFYITPIFYLLNFVDAKSHLAAQVLLLNPMAQIIQDTRYLLVTSQTLTFEQLYINDWYRLVPISIVILLTFCGAWYFRKKSAGFAEEV